VATKKKFKQMFLAIWKFLSAKSRNLARKKKEKAGLEMEMITHPDTRCWASKLTMLFSFEWQVPCLWQQLFCWLPYLHNGVT